MVIKRDEFDSFVLLCIMEKKFKKPTITFIKLIIFGKGNDVKIVATNIFIGCRSLTICINVQYEQNRML